MPIILQIGEKGRQQGLTIKALAARPAVAYNTAHALPTGRATRNHLDTPGRMWAALGGAPGELFIRRTPREPTGCQHDTGGSYGPDPDRAMDLADPNAASSR